jgi:hypothetical protein
MALQAQLLRKTSDEVQRQADWMETQAGHMSSQLAEMKRQADTMAEQLSSSHEKERAKLRITLDPFRPFKPDDGGLSSYEITGSVSIYGLSEAFINNTRTYASIGPEGIDDPLPEWVFPLHIPAVIRAGSEPQKFVLPFVNAKDGPASDEEMQAVRTGDAIVYCAIRVAFTDAFGQKWVLNLKQRFRLFWKPITLDESGFIGEWEYYGKPWENREKRKHPN